MNQQLQKDLSIMNFQIFLLLVRLFQIFLQAFQFTIFLTLKSFSVFQLMNGRCVMAKHNTTIHDITLCIHAYVIIFCLENTLF